MTSHSFKKTDCVLVAMPVAYKKWKFCDEWLQSLKTSIFIFNKMEMMEVLLTG